jgi:predicted ATP-grasp superfamily ATP-dependent carboligase
MVVVLVTDAHTRAALATVRSLGRAGHRVVAAAERLPALAAVSRYAAARELVPAALGDPNGFVAAVRDLVSAYGIHVVVPVTDAAMRALLSAGPIDAIIAGPDPQSFMALSDKAALLARAAAVGLHVPRSVIAPDDASMIAAVRDIGCPCVLKPHRSVIGDPRRAFAIGVRRVFREADLLPPLPRSAFPVVVQEWVPGVGEGLFFLMDRGRTVAAFAHRRLREKPPGGGVSVYREAIPLPADIADGAARLLEDVGWHGVAMVEFRREVNGPNRGPAHLMEVNGRLWGSLQLAIDAGIDFPELLLRVAIGEHPAPIQGYRVGVRSRWFWGDVDHVLLRLLRSRERLGLGPDAPSRWRVLWEFMKFARAEDRLEVFRLRDLRPFLQETRDWIRGRGS